MNIVTTSPRAAALSLVLGIGGLVTLVPAHEAKAAIIAYNTNGNLCRATSSAGAAAFYYYNTYIWNASTSIQHLTCVFPTARVSNSNASVNTILYWDSGTTAASVTCTAQMASRYIGVNVISSGNTQILPLAASSSGSITFPTLTRSQPWETVDIICSVPPGFKLGLAQNFETD